MEVDDERVFDGETHNACRERRLMMLGVPHHQGSRSLSGYAQIKHGYVISLFIPTLNST